MNGTSDLDIANEAVRTGSRILVLTGAGISAESGVPTFRGGGDTWRGMPFQELSSARMVNEDLPLVWEWFDYRRSVISHCEPNAAHLAVAAGQKEGQFREVTLVTQNIDGLHRAAGSTELIELHGHIDTARCLACGNFASLLTLPNDERPPVCAACGDSMRPHVVLFGEGLEEEDLLNAYEKAAACDVCIIVGTSAVVHPANVIPQIAKREGAFLIEINLEETELTSSADLSLRNTACEVLPEIFAVPSASGEATNESV